MCIDIQLYRIPGFVANFFKNLRLELGGRLPLAFPGRPQPRRAGVTPEGLQRFCCLKPAQRYAAGVCKTREEAAVPIEQSKVGEVAAELMDILETTYEEDAEISAVMLITAVNHDDGTKTTVHHNVSPGMPVHEGLGLLMFVQSVIAKGTR